MASAGKAVAFDDGMEVDEQPGDRKRGQNEPEMSEEQRKRTRPEPTAASLRQAQKNSRHAVIPPLSAALTSQIVERLGTDAYVRRMGQVNRRWRDAPPFNEKEGTAPLREYAILLKTNEFTELCERALRLGELSRELLQSLLQKDGTLNPTKWQFMHDEFPDLLEQIVFLIPTVSKQDDRMAAELPYAAEHIYSLIPQLHVDVRKTMLAHHFRIRQMGTHCNLTCEDKVPRPPEPGFLEHVYYGIIRHDGDMWTMRACRLVSWGPLVGTWVPNIQTAPETSRGTEEEMRELLLQTYPCSDLENAMPGEGQELVVLKNIKDIYYWYFDEESDEPEGPLSAYHGPYKCDLGVYAQ